MTHWPRERGHEDRVEERGQVVLRAADCEIQNGRHGRERHHRPQGDRERCRAGCRGAQHSQRIRDGIVADIHRRNQGQMGLDEAELRAAIKGAHAIIIRSATKCDSRLIAASDSLTIIGRAGVGLDNVDCEAATEKGILVANAPTSNSISAAEHTLGLMLSLARNIPQAHDALTSGRSRCLTIASG